MSKSQEAIIKRFAISTTFFEREEMLHLFGDSCTIFIFKSLPIALKLSPSFGFVSIIIWESRVKCFCLFINTSFLPGGNIHIYVNDFNR